MARAIKSKEARKEFRNQALFGLLVTPIRIFCESCDRYIPSKMPWECGYCGKEHTTTVIYSFLNKCSNCKRVPKSVQCPHCQSLNFLGKASEDKHPAKKTVTAPLPETEEVVRAKKKIARADAKEDLQHEIEIVRLNADLAKLKSSTDLNEEKAILERIEKRARMFFAEKMGVFEIAELLKKVCAEKYKENPQMLERSEEVAQAFIEHES